MKEVTPLSSILTTPLSLRRCWRLLEQQDLLGWTRLALTILVADGFIFDHKAVPQHMIHTFTTFFVGTWRSFCANSICSLILAIQLMNASVFIEALV